LASGDAGWRNPITGIAGCCPRAANADNTDGVLNITDAAQDLARLTLGFTQPHRWLLFTRDGAAGKERRQI
jgi:hypothetical protein